MDEGEDEVVEMRWGQGVYLLICSVFFGLFPGIDVVLLAKWNGLQRSPKAELLYGISIEELRKWRSGWDGIYIYWRNCTSFSIFWTVMTD